MHYARFRKHFNFDGVQMDWRPFDNGATISGRGSEDGIILRDEEHVLGARITLERECTIAPLAITCGIYGWMFHTRYFGSENEASSEYELMKEGVATVVLMIPLASDPDVNTKAQKVCDAICSFVKQYP